MHHYMIEHTSSRFLSSWMLLQKVTQGLYFLKEQNQNLLSHKLLPRSPTMAFSSVRENVTPNTQLEIVLENVIVHYIMLIIYNFILYFITLL